MSASFFGGSKQNKSFIWILALTFFIVAFLSFSAKGKSEQNDATFSNESDGIYKPVLDNAGIFSKAELRQLESFLANLDERTGIQIAVIVAKDLDGEDIESFSMKHAEQYKLGQKGTDNGVLLTVAMKEREIRIETGYGAEGILTDAVCARIIRNKITPLFKQEKYFEGIESGIKAIASVLTSDETMTENQSQTENSAEEDDEESPFSVLAFVFFVVLIFVIFGRGRNLWLLPFIFGGGSSSRRNSDSFRKGGGGSFGGGGASGRW